ncbi:hypothetical protein [Ligilactobacillus aviarius]|uniref:hypothetical protein n=1 Tax=Ligilactobacillus aviarius TaxID=1606 RepID=UPI00255C01B6|nr:hypothetical protein [Ligilactobacillus aviarius]
MKAKKMIELTHDEDKVLSVIRHREEPINVKDIVKLTNIPQRQVMRVIECLRCKGIPVVASRTGATGIKIARTEEEKDKCVRSLTSQSAKLLATSAHLKLADLETWKERIKVM